MPPCHVTYPTPRWHAGLLSTPAVSAIIRNREGGAAVGGIILTASHNPGGPDGDVGVKYNTGNGGPAPEAVTDAIYECSKAVTALRICSALPDVDLAAEGRTEYFASADAAAPGFVVEVISSTADYEAAVLPCFDVPALRKLVAREDFSFVYDAMHGVAGAYASSIFVDALGADPSCLLNATPLPDFGGGHPDPNLAYASVLVKKLGLTPRGERDEAAAATAPAFGAAADGDADRNMILGRGFFVTPSDSVAVIAANWEAIKQFRDAGGLKGVARSMPTSRALDAVAASLGVPRFVVPTGWKWFGSLMDSKAVYGKEDYTPFLCGEESFGTGSSHVREKDGIWAVLAWMSILAARNAETPIGSLVSVEDVVREMWAKCGRCFYQRHDYEEVDSKGAHALMDTLRAEVAAFKGPREVAGVSFTGCDEFEYTDSVTGDKAAQQGMRLFFADGAGRVVFRLSGTGSVGATIRMYVEMNEKDPSRFNADAADVLAPLVAAAIELSHMKEHTGRDEATVIT